MPADVGDASPPAATSRQSWAPAVSNLEPEMHRKSTSPVEEIPTLAGALAILSHHEVELRSAGVRHAAVFGSVARGEATAASDIDVLVELETERSISLFDLMGIELRLSDIFGRKVDVVSKRGLRPRLDDTIVADAVAAF